MKDGCWVVGWNWWSGIFLFMIMSPARLLIRNDVMNEMERSFMSNCWFYVIDGGSYFEISMLIIDYSWHGILDYGEIRIVIWTCAFSGFGVFLPWLLYLIHELYGW